MMGEKNRPPSGIERRDFLKAAAAAAAAGAVHPLALEASDPSFPRWVEQEQEAASSIQLGQGEHPALVFQAYPGGTGSLMEKLWREHGPRMFDRPAIRVRPWRGSVPTNEEDIAFLPVHRLSALVRSRRISSVDLTEIYLDRIIDPKKVPEIKDLCIELDTINDSIIMAEKYKEKTDLKLDELGFSDSSKNEIYENLSYL